MLLNDYPRRGPCPKAAVRSTLSVPCCGALLAQLCPCCHGEELLSPCLLPAIAWWAPLGNVSCRAGPFGAEQGLGPILQPPLCALIRALLQKKPWPAPTAEFWKENYFSWLWSMSSKVWVMRPLWEFQLCPSHLPIPGEQSWEQSTTNHGAP